MDERVLKIATKIKALRVEKGYVSAEFFAWEHKIPRVQYWRMEKGTNFTIKNLLRILDTHQISVEDFFFYSRIKKEIKLFTEIKPSTQ